MRKLPKFSLVYLAFSLSVGCASQEDLLHADVFGQDRGAYSLPETEDIEDLGKTPRDKMLEERREGEKNKNRSTKDRVIDLIIPDDQRE